MGDVVGASCVCVRRVEVKRQQLSDGRIGQVSGVGLFKNRGFVRKAPNAAIASKIVVEGTVFLDENDHMLDISHFTASGRSGPGT